MLVVGLSANVSLWAQVDVSGRWRGTMVDSFGVSRTSLDATFTQSGSSLTGTLVRTESGFSTEDRIMGSLSGSAITFQFSALDIEVWEFRGTITGTNTISGTWGVRISGFPVPGANGTFRLDRVVTVTPTLSSLSPSSVRAGGPAFTLTVNGSNFISGSVVRWNGSDRATGFVSSSQLRATILASDIASPGRALVTVFNPSPVAAVSNSLTLTITDPLNPSPKLGALSPVSATVAGASFSLTVYGSDFVSGSIVRWNGSNRATTFVSSSELRAAILASDIASPGRAQVTVFNPSPGGGTATPLAFAIISPTGSCIGHAEPTLRLTLPPGFYIAEARNASSGGREGYWGMEVLVSRGVLAGGFNLGGGAQEKAGTPAFGAFFVTGTQTVRIRVDAQVVPGGNAAQFSMGVRLLNSARQPIGTDQFGTTFVQFERTLPEGFYIIEVVTGEGSPRATFQMGLGADAFTGGVVVGGFVAPGLVGFGAFYVPETQDVNITVLGPSYGSAGANCMRLTLLDANRRLVREVPPVAAVDLASVTVSPIVITGGGNATGTITLSGAAPAGGVSIALQTSNPVVQAPAVITVPAGQTSATFSITTQPVTSAQNVMITASLGNVSKTATLTLNPVSAQPRQPDFKLPLPGGNDWLLSVEAGTPTLACPSGMGGLFYGGGYDCLHSGRSKYSLDFPDNNRQDGELTGKAEVDILAAASGTVRTVVRNPGQQIGCRCYGNYVVIDHGNGYTSTYGHLKDNTIPADIIIGRSVSAGQKLGVMGTSGDSTGIHVHFEIRYNDDGTAESTVLDQVVVDGRRIVDYKVGSTADPTYYRSTNTSPVVPAGLSGRWETKYDWTFSNCPIPPGFCTHCLTDHIYSATQSGNTLQGSSLDSQAAQITGTVSGNTVNLVLKEFFGICTRTFRLTGAITGQRITGTVSGGDDNCGTCKINGTFEINIVR